MVDVDEKVEKTWQLTKKFYPVHIKVTAPVYDVMLRFLETGAYLNLSEYINELFQQYFSEKGIELEAINFSGEDEDEDIIEEQVQGTAIINARLPIPMKKAVDQVMDSGLYFNVSHYVREVIRKDLEARGIELEGE